MLCYKSPNTQGSQFNRKKNIDVLRAEGRFKVGLRVEMTDSNYVQGRKLKAYFERRIKCTKEGHLVKDDTGEYKLLTNWY